MNEPNKRNEEDSAATRAFRTAAHAVAHTVGTPAAFLVALGVIVVWGVSGPLFHYSDTWQLIINTSTTIVTFLVVFLIQNTQNRDAKAIHLKLDELIRANQMARNSLVRLENLSDAELDRLESEFTDLSENVRHTRHRRRHRSKAHAEGGVTAEPAVPLPNLGTPEHPVDLGEEDKGGSARKERTREGSAGLV